MCTKPRKVEDLLPGGFWEAGPKFLLTEESSWPIKLTYKKDLEGEVAVSKKAYSIQVASYAKDILTRLVERISTWKRIVRVVAWVLQCWKKTVWLPAM